MTDEAMEHLADKMLAIVERRLARAEAPSRPPPVTADGPRMIPASRGMLNIRSLAHVYLLRRNPDLRERTYLLRLHAANARLQKPARPKRRSPSPMDERRQVW